MAVTVANKTNGADFNNTNVSGSYTAPTASVTPGANKVLLLTVHNTIGSGATVAEKPSSISLGTGLSGFSFTEVASVPHAVLSSVNQSYLVMYRALTGGTPGTGVININFTHGPNTCSWSLDEVSGSDTGGTNGGNTVVQSVTNTGHGVTSLTATLGTFTDSTNNVTFAAFGAVSGDTDAWNTTDLTFTPKTLFTELSDIGSEYSNLETEWRAAADTTPSTTTSASAQIAGIAVELKMLPTGSAPVPTITGNVVEGNQVVISGTGTNTPTSGTVTLTKVSGSEAVTQGPTASTLSGTNNVNFSCTFNGVPPGVYSVSTTLTNASGSNSASGNNVTLIGVQGSPQAGTSSTPAVAVTSSTALTTSGIGLTASGTADLKGDASGVLRAYLDSVPSGTTLGPDTVTITSGSWTYTKSLVPSGTWQLRMTATANNQTTTVTDGTLTFLGLTGTPGLPTT